MATFSKLTSLLNLATLGGDPVDNPEPWSWETWKGNLHVDRAPWAGPRWSPKTGFSRQQWTLARGFIVAFYGAGDNHTDRCQFVANLKHRDLFDGLCLLINKLEQDWEKARIDKVVETVLESMGITELKHLHLEVYVAHASMDTIAELLLGSEAYQMPNTLHPLVASWVLDLLMAMMRRWKLVYNSRALIVEAILHDVYIASRGVSLPACGPQQLIAYLQALSSLIKDLNLTLDDDHQRQLDYYRDLLYMIDAFMSGSEAFGRCLPPNMRNALVNMDTYAVADRTKIKSAREACSHAIDAASEHIPDIYDEGFDLYMMLRDQTLGIVVGLAVDYVYLEESPENEGADSPAWQDVEKAAFLFAALTLPHSRD